MKALFDKFKTLVESRGGVVIGNQHSGAMSAPIPFLGDLKGNYIISGYTVRITITQKPFLVACSTIEENLRSLLKSNS